MSMWRRIRCWWAHRVHIETSDHTANMLLQGTMKWRTYRCEHCGKRYCYTIGAAYL